MISKEEAIEILNNEKPSCGEKVTYSEGEVCEAYDMAIEALSHPERPKGRWEEIRNAYGEIEGWICTCGREVKCKDNFCPNCGADMRGEEE